MSAILSDQPLAQWLVLQPAKVVDELALWQPLTANIIVPEGRAELVFGTLFVQWFIGSELEGFWGIRRYLALVIGSGVAGYAALVGLGAFVPAAAEVTVGGATAIDLAAVAAFAVLFGRRPIRLLGAVELSSRTLAIGIIVISIVSPLARGNPWPIVVPWVVAIAVTLLVTTQPWRRIRDSGKLGGPRRTRKKRKADHLRVVRPDRELLN